MREEGTEKKERKMKEGREIREEGKRLKGGVTEKREGKMEGGRAIQ